MKAFYENRKYKHGTVFFTSYVESLNFVAHWHKECEVIFVLEGEIGVGIEKDYRVLNKGMMSVCGANDIHYYSSESMNSRAIIMLFMPEMSGLSSAGITDVELKSAFLSFEGDKEDKISSLMEQLIKENNNKSMLSEQLAKVKLTEFVMNVLRHGEGYYDLCRNTSGTGKKQALKPMQKALKYLEDNYTDDISLQSISDIAQLSPFYFSRLFKDTTGTNYNTYLSQLRIESAEELIKKTNNNIIDIAYQTGFKSIRTFNRTFKSLRGYTPQSIRRENI